MQATSVIDLPPGVHVGGRYKLLKAIGQGGFGITYIGWDEEQHCRVAVKECFPQGICIRDAGTGAVMPARESYEPCYMKALEYMRREVRTLQGLNHDSIVHFKDVLWGNGSVFYVMPWLPGGTLRDVIETRRAEITPEQSMAWLRVLLEALRYLHERSITHRDIKPANIMFDEKQNPVIIDFGAALNRAERTGTTTTSQGAFSRNYAAPEQITGKGHVGAWTDLYSLAATWYELLTGVPPEAADARLAQDDMKSLTKQAAKIGYPLEVLALLDCNMSLNVNNRCQSVEQCLQCWKDGTLPRLENLVERRRKTIVLTSAFVILGLGGLYGAYSAFLGGTPARYLEQASSPSNREALVQYVEEQIQAKDFRNLCDEYMGKCSVLKGQHAQTIQRMVNQYSAAIEQVDHEEEGEKLFNALEDEKRKILLHFSDDFDQLRKNFLNARAAYSISRIDISTKVKPRNLGEEIMMPGICEGIAQDLSQYESKFLIFSSDQQDATQLLEKSAKLEEKIAKKNDSLRKKR